MESASVPAPGSTAPAGSAPGEKGLKTGAIGFASSLVIGVASTAPGYSLAASLGFVVAVAGIGVFAPAIFIVAFIPMLFIAAAYYYMNRADPDCGTTFSWVTKAMGPQIGWVAGWAIVVADIIVMANLAQIAGLYSFLLFGWDSAAASTAAVTAVGVMWIAVMTAICVIGIELSARTQVVLLGAEVVTLAIFAVVALVKVYSGDALPGGIDPSLSWINPFEIPLGDMNPFSTSEGTLVGGVLIAVFIYWGWDSTVTVNEETEGSSTTPGRAAIIATIILVGIYVIVSIAAQAYGGTEVLVENSDDVLSVLGNDVFGYPLDRILIIAVLTSAAASTQTTILPTARTTLSMARAHAMPKALGDVHPRFLTPHVSTILMGAFSVVWYVFLTIVSENILFDSIAALGLMIAFYYGLTGFACVIYYRRELLKSAKNFLFIGVAPLVGALMLTYLFVKSCAQFTLPENSESGDSWLGLGPPLVIGAGFILLGVVLMLVTWMTRPEFFRRRPEVVPPELAAHAPGAPHEGGS
ncbi:MAG: APC family permease [Solirubrobacterales bacterium]